MGAGNDGCFCVVPGGEPLFSFPLGSVSPSWINFVNMPCTLFHQIGFKGSFNLNLLFCIFGFIVLHLESDVMCFTHGVCFYFYHDIYSGKGRSCS